MDREGDIVLMGVREEGVGIKRRDVVEKGVRFWGS